MEPPDKPFINFLLFLLIIFSFFNTSFQYTFSPPISSPDAHYIYDLPSKSSDDLKGNSKDWIFHSSSYSGPPETLQCGTLSYISTSTTISNTNYFQRTYSDLPFHTFVYYAINIIAIDSWTSSDSYSIIIDGRTLATWKPSDYLTQYGSPICGDSNTKDFLTTIIGKTTHNADTLTLKIIVNLASSSSSSSPNLGISDVYLSFPTAVLSTETTQICPNNNCIYNTQTCSNLQYEQLGACIAGCSNCLYPWGTQTGQAHRCFEGFSFNGADCIACQTNCLLCSDSSIGSCNRCMDGYVLDLDGICKTSCGDVSSVVKGIGAAKYCIDRCPSGKFMLWNWTCVAACELPLVQRSVPDQGDFCDYNCHDDGSEYLYWNTSCKSTCPYPYKSRMYAENKFCDLPCPSTAEYLHEDGTCQAICAEPLVIAEYETIKLCVSATLTEEETKKIQVIADSINTMDAISNYFLLAFNIIFPANPGSALKRSLNNMLFSLRYINATSSPELTALFSMLHITTNDYTGHKILPDDIANHFIGPSPPEPFAKYNLHSKFLVSYGNSIIWFGILAIVLICLIIFEFCLFKKLRNIRLTRFILKRTRIILQNYLLGQFYAASGQIFFFACLDWTGDATGDGLSGLNDTMIVFSLFTGIFIVSVHLVIIYKYRKINQNDDKNKDAKINQFKWKHEGFIILFGDYNDKTWSRQTVLLILVLRCVIVNLAIALLYKFPPLQGFVILVLNISVLVYFFCMKPFKDPIEYYQQMVFELALFSANICVISLILADRSNNYHPNVVKNASNGVIITSVAFMCIPLIFLLARIIIPVYKRIFPTKAKLTLEKLDLRPTQTSVLILEDPTFRGQSPETPPKIEDLPIEEIRDHGWQGMQASPMKRRLRIKGPWNKEDVVPAEKPLKEVEEVNSSFSFNHSEKSLLHLETESAFVPVRGNNVEVQEDIPDDFNELPEEVLHEEEEEEERDSEMEEREEMEDGVLPLEGQSEFIPVENEEVQEKDDVVFPRSKEGKRNSCLITSFGFND